MGDRCYLIMYGKVTDQKTIEAAMDFAGGGTIEKDNPSLFCLEIEESNYADYDERLKLAEAGISFYGHHGPGGEYDATTFYAAGGEYAQLPELFNSELAAELDAETLEVTPACREEIEHFRRVRAACWADLGIRQ